MLERDEAEVENSVRMPSREIMLKKLEKTPLPLRQQGVLFHFVTSVAGQTETGSTLVAAWEGACQEANKKFRMWKDLAITRLLHAYSFSGVVDAITPDRVVARDAKEELRFLEEIRA